MHCVVSNKKASLKIVKPCVKELCNSLQSFKSLCCCRQWTWKPFSYIYLAIDMHMYLFLSFLCIFIETLPHVTIQFTRLAQIQSIQAYFPLEKLAAWGCGYHGMYMYTTPFFPPCFLEVTAMFIYLCMVSTRSPCKNAACSKYVNDTWYRLPWPIDLHQCTVILIHWSCSFCLVYCTKGHLTLCSDMYCIVWSIWTSRWHS